jgi:NAD(P)-dependent dehydrogenase (short-subunit alcohol dehydrogenase family)
LEHGAGKQHMGETMEELGKGAIVVTGASTGIGYACARLLDAHGYAVFAGMRRDVDAARLREGASERLHPLMLDVTDSASIATAAAEVAAAVGASGLHGLVNNAGIAVAGPLEFLPLSELRHQLEVNVIGQVAVTQAFLPLLRQGHGRIVNIGSIGGKLAGPMLGAYNASKFALEGLTDALRRELRPWNIPVAIVEPGTTATPIWQKSLAAGDSLAADLPPQTMELYGRAIEGARRVARHNAKGGGTPPDAVAQAVLHALTAPRPRTRYPVGREARIGAILARLLPDRTLDRLLGGRGG